MAKESKLEVVRAIEFMCNQTDALQNLRIEVGYRDWDGNFVPSTERLDRLCFHWVDQDRRFGRYQNIEEDSGYRIIIDAMKVIGKLA